MATNNHESDDQKDITPFEGHRTEYRGECVTILYCILELWFFLIIFCRSLPALPMRPLN
jgi:hypothetical protein